MKRLVLLVLLTVFLGSPMVHSRQPTPAEMEAISKETRLVFESFLQLWQEERYFEMYDYGKKQSREILSLEEFATRMVELDWVPVGLSPEKPSEISYRYRTLLYMNANIVFRIAENDPFQSPNQAYLPFTHIKLFLFLIRWPIRHFD